MVVRFSLSAERTPPKTGSGLSNWAGPGTLEGDFRRLLEEVANGGGPVKIAPGLMEERVPVMALLTCRPVISHPDIS